MFGSFWYCGLWTSDLSSSKLNEEHRGKVNLNKVDFVSLKSSDVLLVSPG